MRLIVAVVTWVFPAGLVILQLWSAFQCIRRLRAEGDRFRKVDEAAHPGETRPGDGSGWMTWVRGQFPAHRPPSGSYSRDDVIQELSRRLDTDEWIVLLRRTGIMAPLVGVLITGTGFYNLALPDLVKSGTAELTRALQPVAIGVIAGTLLALLNQFLLQGVEWLEDRVRQAGIGWLDAKVWPAVISYQDGTARSKVEALERVASSMETSLKREHRAAEATRHAADMIERAAGALVRELAAFAGQSRDSANKLADVGGILDGATQRFRAAIPDGQRISDAVLNSVRRFGELIEDRFEEKLRLQEDASRQLAEATGKIVGMLDGFEQGSTALNGQIGRQVIASERFLNVIEQRALPHEEQFVGLVETLKGTVNSLDLRLKELDVVIRAASGRIDDVAPILQGTLKSLDASAVKFGETLVDYLEPAAKRHLDAVGIWSADADKTSSLVGNLETAAKSVADAAPRYAEAGHQLKEVIETQLTPAQRTLREIAEGIKLVVAQFARDLRAFGGELRASSPAFQGFTGLVEGEFRPTAESLRQVREVAGEFGGAVQRIGQLIARHDQEAGRLDASYASLNAATERLATSGDSFREALSQKVLPTQQAIDRVLNQLDGATRSLNAFLDDSLKLAPEFEQHLHQLQALVEGMGPLATAGPAVLEAIRGLNENVDRMSSTMAGLAERMDAFMAIAPKNSKNWWSF